MKKAHMFTAVMTKFTRVMLNPFSLEGKNAVQRVVKAAQKIIGTHVRT